MAERAKARTSNAGEKRKASTFMSIGDPIASNAPVSPKKKMGRTSKKADLAARTVTNDVESSASGASNESSTSNKRSRSASTTPSNLAENAVSNASGEGEAKVVKAKAKGKSKQSTKPTNAVKGSTDDFEREREREKERHRQRNREYRRKKKLEKATAAGSKNRSSAEADDKSEAEEEDANDREDIVDDNIYCTCKRPYDPDQAMLACDNCNEWYHTRCMGIKDEWINIVDQFICSVCHPRTLERTTWKRQCLNKDCEYPALLPLSKYCSERCGLVIAIQSIKAFREKSSKYRRLGAKPLDRIYTEQVKEAVKKEGCSTWADDPKARKDNEDVGKEHELATWNTMALRAERIPMFDLEAARNGICAGPDFSSNVDLLKGLSHTSSKYDEDRVRWRLELDEIATKRHKVNVAIDLVEARQTLYQLALARKAELVCVVGRPDDEEEDEQPPSKRGLKKKVETAAPEEENDGENEDSHKKKKKKAKERRPEPPCGFDERLGWDDELLAAYMTTEQWAKIREDPQHFDGRVIGDWCADVADHAGPSSDTAAAETLETAVTRRPPKVCGLPSRMCKRHITWVQFSEDDGHTKERDRLMTLDKSLADRENEIQMKLDALEVRLEKARAQAVHRLTQQGLNRRLGLV